MSLKEVGVIELPDAQGSSFDHGAFDPVTRRIFVAHTARDRVEVLDHDLRRHFSRIDGFPEAAGVVADGGHVLVTNRRSAQLVWLDACTLETRGVFDTGTRPNGVAIVSRSHLAVVACIGDEQHGPELQVFDLRGGRRWAANLPGQPRWCVTDDVGQHVFLAIREPSMLLVAQLPELDGIQHSILHARGAHGLDIDYGAGLLYVACDDRGLVEVNAVTGEVRRNWPLSGIPDATFFNPATGLVHVAIGKPGLIQSIDPRSGVSTQLTTAIGAKTTALVSPDTLYVFSPTHGGALVLTET